MHKPDRHDVELALERVSGLAGATPRFMFFGLRGHKAELVAIHNYCQGWEDAQRAERRLDKGGELR